MGITLIDVGASLHRNYVEWLKYYQAANLCIYAFEPEKTLYTRIIREISTLPKELRERIRVYNTVVSDHNGVTQFYVCNNRSSSSTKPFVNGNIRRWKYPLGCGLFKTIGVQSRKCVTLESFCKANKIKHIDCLYIGTQGDALQVLKGLSSSQFLNIRQIIVKVQSTPFELYAHQSNHQYITKLLRRRYFTEQSRKNITHNQEQIIKYINKPLFTKEDSKKWFDVDKTNTNE